MAKGKAEKKIMSSRKKSSIFCQINSFQTRLTLDAIGRVVPCLDLSTVPST